MARQLDPTYGYNAGVLLPFQSQVCGGTKRRSLDHIQRICWRASES